MTGKHIVMTSSSSTNVKVYINGSLSNTGSGPATFTTSSTGGSDSISIMQPSVFCNVFFKQKTAYEISRSDWSSDVCSSDLFPVTICGTGNYNGTTAYMTLTPDSNLKPTTLSVSMWAKFTNSLGTEYPTMMGTGASRADRKSVV